MRYISLAEEEKEQFTELQKTSENSVIREQEEAKEVRETYVKDGQETKEEAQKGGKETQEGSEEKVVQESEKVIIKEVKDSSYYNRR